MRRTLRHLGAVAVTTLALGALPAAPAAAATQTYVNVCGATNFAWVVKFPSRGNYESRVIDPAGSLRCWSSWMNSIGKTEAIEIWGYPVRGNEGRIQICSVNKNLSTVATFSLSVRGKELKDTGCSI